jgi:hypothetical protein
MSLTEQFQNLLESYFGIEIGTEEEILSHYKSKFKTIQNNLLLSINLSTKIK